MQRRLLLPDMQTRLKSLTVWALLVLPLSISPILGLLTPYVALAFTIPVFVWAVVSRRFADSYGPYSGRAFISVFVVQLALFTATADSVSDTLRAFNFTSLLTFGAVTLMLRQKSGRRSAERVALLATLGVIGGFAAVTWSAVVGHAPRPTAINIGPIVLSNGLLALGFLGLGGALVRRDALSWGYLLVPLLAIGATLLTGSRGPLIGVPLELGVAAVFIWRLRFDTSKRAALIAIVALLVVGVAAALALQGRAGTLVQIAHSFVGGEAVDDESTRQRFVLYAAGLQSFLQSPWIGHGWGNIMSSVVPFVPASDAKLLRLPQLHNDVLNFAVAGGLVGVACYFVVLTAPVIGAIRSARDTLRPFRIYATTLIMIVYAAGGLTDLMFGFEFHTFLFATINAIVLGYCGTTSSRDDGPVPTSDGTGGDDGG